MNINEIIENMYDELMKSNEPSEKKIIEIVKFLQSKRIIIYGRGNVGEKFYKIFKKLNISINCYVDRLANEFVKSEEIPVYLPSFLNNNIDNKNEHIVIIGAGNMQTSEHIEGDFKKLNTNIPMIRGLYLVYILQYYICSLKLSKNEVHDIKECISYHVKPYKCPMFKKHIEKMAHKENPFEKIDGSEFNEVGYLLSQVCNLKCKHCLEAVPYLPDRVTLPTDIVIKDLKKLTNACKFLHRIDLVGGETFLNPNIIEILKEILKIPKIGYIGVFTNGTIIPSDELCQVLKNPRIIVTLSDYGESLNEKLKNKVPFTLEKLNQHNIKYFFFPHRFWLDLNNFEKHDVDDEKLENTFKDCFLAACRRLYNGTLYHCPYQCNGIKLGKFEKRKVECIDIHDYSTKELSVELDKFEKLKFIDACRHCNIPIGPEEVVAGEQL